MILIGDKNIPFETVQFVNTHAEIGHSKPNSTVLFDFNIELMQYTKENSVEYGVVISSIKDAIYANALGAKYIICDNSISKKIQDIATNYMFDSRILAIIEDESEIEEIALKNIDGVIYKSVLDN